MIFFLQPEAKMSLAVQERKEPIFVSQEDPVSFLKANRKLDGPELFSLFLETFAKGVRRDRIGNDSPHSFTILDGDFSECNQSLIDGLMKTCLLKTFDSKKGDFGNSECTIHARLFGVSELQAQTDIDAVRQYQKDRINPSTFMPLDYFSQPKESQEFVSAQLELQMGDSAVPAAEYFCPFTRYSTKEESAIELIVGKPTIQIRRMDKKFIGAGLKHIGAIFERIVKPAKVYTEEALQDDLALLAFNWTFCSPYEEESRAIVDLMQTTLAALHGYQFRVQGKTKIYDLALSRPYFPTFLQKYKGVVKIFKE